MEDELENTSILELLIKWKFHLGVILLFSSGMAFIFSGPAFITPMYKSNAKVYPSNIAPYSNESMTEQMMEMMKSGFVKDSLIKEFDLYKRYSIVDNGKDQSKLNYIYSERVSIERTDYEAIQVSVLDKDPLVSKKMVEKLIYFTDILIRKLQNEKLSEVVEMNKKNLQKVKVQLDSVNTVLDKYRKDYSILDYDIQLEQISKNYYKSIASNGRGVEEMKKMLEVLKQRGSEYQFLSKRSETLARFYSEQETELLKSIRDYDRSFTYTNVLSKPIEPDQKAYPIRWIIVLVSGISSLFLAILILLNFERKKLIL
jgi:capsule polysaccharide export protein KpsE/RkpR